MRSQPASRHDAVMARQRQTTISLAKGAQRAALRRAKCRPRPRRENRPPARHTGARRTSSRKSMEKPGGGTATAKGRANLVVAATQGDGAGTAGAVGGKDNPAVIVVAAQVGQIKADGQVVQRICAMRRKADSCGSISGRSGKTLAARAPALPIRHTVRARCQQGRTHRFGHIRPPVRATAGCPWKAAASNRILFHLGTKPRLPRPRHGTRRRDRSRCAKRLETRSANRARRPAAGRPRYRPQAGMAIEFGAELQRLARGVKARRQRMQHAAAIAQAGNALAIEQMGVDTRHLRRDVGANSHRAAGQLIDQLEGAQVKVAPAPR
jgi:hypothetical protein